MLKLWKDNKIICPICRKIKYVVSREDIPHTNIGLIYFMEYRFLSQLAAERLQEFEIVNPDKFHEVKEEVRNGGLVL